MLRKYFFSTWIFVLLCSFSCDSLFSQDKVDNPDEQVQEEIRSSTEQANDSLKTESYQLVDGDKLNIQAKQHGFDITSPHKFFIFSIDGKEHKSLFPPLQISPTSFQYANLATPDSLAVYTSLLESLDYLEFQFEKKYQFNVVTRYCLLSYLTTAVTASFLYDDDLGFGSMSMIGLPYFMSSFAIGGMFSSYMPYKVRCNDQEYLTNSKKRNWGVGLYYGYISFRPESDYHRTKISHRNNTHLTSLKLYLKGKYFY